MNVPTALCQYVTNSLSTLRVRWRSTRSRAVLLMLVALINMAQGVVCNLHDVSHLNAGATEYSIEGASNFSHDKATNSTSLTDPLNIEAHCLHISCVHSPAFPPSPIVHAFVLALNAVPTAGTRLHWPAPPLGVHFRPPITA